MTSGRTPRLMNKLFALAATGIAAAMLVSCGQPAPTRTLTRSIDLNGAQSLAVELKMGAGELRVAGGSPKLLDATFRFNIPSWEPAVDYHNDNGRGTLTLRQPSTSTSFGKIENDWDLRFNDMTPTSFRADLGAGEAAFTLGSMNLQSVSVHVGAGEMMLDLRGTPKQSYDVTVDGGVGTARIRLPRSVGIVATASGGIGGVSFGSLENRGDTWVNAGHEHDPVVIHLTAHGGIGEINVTAE